MKIDLTDEDIELLVSGGSCNQAVLFEKERRKALEDLKYLNLSEQTRAVFAEIYCAAKATGKMNLSSIRTRKNFQCNCGHFVRNEYKLFFTKGKEISVCVNCFASIRAAFMAHYSDFATMAQWSQNLTGVQPAVVMYQGVKCECGWAGTVESAKIVKAFTTYKCPDCYKILTELETFALKPTRWPV